jgi:hypothetical protein
LRYIVQGFKLLGGDVTGLLFYDAGRIRTDQVPLATNTTNKRALAGWGLGLSAGKEGDFLFKAVVAARAGKEEATSDSAARDPMVWFQAIKWF